MKVLLLGILIMLLILVMMGSPFTGPVHSNAARETSARTMISNIEVALDAFKEDVGRYPRTREGLEALLVEPTSDSEGWNGPYLKRLAPRDPWGREYQYIWPGRHNEDGFDLWSFGPDRKNGTNDDIGNWMTEMQN